MIDKVYAKHRHKNPAPWQGAPAWALELGEILAIMLLQQETIIMPGLADLQAADTAVVELINKLIAEIQRLDAKVTSAPTGTPDSALEPIATDLNNAVTAGTAALTASQTAVP